MRTWIGIALVVLLATTAFGLGPMGGGGMGGGMMGAGLPQNIWGGADFTPVIGQWAEYLMTSKDEEPVTIRISVVGKEDDAYWYEMQMASEEDGGFVTKMLVSGDPGDQDGMKRLIIKAGDEPAIEMPIGMGMGGGMMGGMGGGMMGDQPEGEVEEPDVTPSDLGMETVTVPAGTFKAHHWRIESDELRFDMWQAENVGPYGTVKSTSDDFEMVLTGHGDDAKSIITEEPEKFEMPSFNMKGFGG